MRGWGFLPGQYVAERVSPAMHLFLRHEKKVCAVEGYQSVLECAVSPLSRLIKSRCCRQRTAWGWIRKANRHDSISQDSHKLESYQFALYVAFNLDQMFALDLDLRFLVDSGRQT